MLEWLENTGLSVWIKEGQESIWGYPMILTVHTFAMMVLVGASLVVDLRILGIAPRIPLTPIRPLFRWMWAAVAVSTVTGLLLFMADATLRGASVLFLLKLSLVALGVTTLVLIERRVYAPGTPQDHAAAGVKGLAAASLLVWVLAMTAGRLLAYFT